MSASARDLRPAQAVRADDAVRRGAFRGTALLLRAWIVAALGPARVRVGQRRPAWAKPGHLWLAGASAVALVLLAMLVFDAPAVAWARGLPAAAVRAFATLTEFGRSVWVLVPCAFVLVLCAAAAASLPGASRAVAAAVAARAGFVFAAVAVPGLLVAVVKRLIGRARPHAAGPDHSLSFEFWRWDAAYASLPSGHSTSAFATAFALGVLFPRWRPLWWAFALAIALSRVAVSAHYVSDVIAGAVVGVFGALVMRNWFAIRRLAFVVAPDRAVRTLPGPSWRRVRTLASAFAAHLRSRTRP